MQSLAWKTAKLAPCGARFRSTLLQRVAPGLAEFFELQQLIACRVSFTIVGVCISKFLLDH